MPNHIEIKKWNDDYWVEGMDRCYTIAQMMELLLLGHPSVIATDSEEAVIRAIEILNEVHQDIGAASLEEPNFN